MHKRVLIVEAADAIRSVAENVLRQNGYEVISVAGAEKALEVLGFSVPDIVIVGADVTCEDKRPLYEKIMSDPKTSSIPMLFFAGTEKNDLPYPEEVIIPRPFDPQDLIQRVRIFSGQSVPDEKKTASNPLGEGSLDDELLDAALGIDTKDNIQVTDSEVLGQTTQIRIGHKKPKKASDKLIGFDHYEDENDDENHTHIESLMIEEENSEIKKKPAKPIPPPNSGTSKLEIMNDQYGLVDPDAFKDENVDKDHDYDWFINSMREDNENPGKKTSPPEGDSGKMSFTENSAIVDPITPPPKTPPSQKPVSTDTFTSSKASAGVEKFIDEFKKEVERIHSDEPETMVVDESLAVNSQTPENMVWEEKLEKVSPEQVNLFTRQLTLALAERIAEKIAAKIDPVKLTQLIKSEIIAHLEDKK